LSEIREQVVYLIDNIHLMKDRLSKLSEMYKNNSKVESDEVLKSIDSIHEIVNSELINVRKRKNTELEKNPAVLLVSHLRNSLCSIIKNK